MDFDTWEITATGLGCYARFGLFGGIGRFFFLIEEGYPKDNVASSIQHLKRALDAE